MSDAVLLIEAGRRFKAEVVIKVLQVTLRGDAHRLMRMVVLQLRQGALHHLAADALTAPARVGADPADRGFGKAGARRQQPATGYYVVVRLCDQVRGGGVEVVRVLVAAGLLNDEHCLSQLAEAVIVARAHYCKGQGSPSD